MISLIFTAILGCNCNGMSAWNVKEYQTNNDYTFNNKDTYITTSNNNETGRYTSDTYFTSDTSTLNIYSNTGDTSENYTNIPEIEWIDISAGRDSAVAVHSNGLIYGWGQDSYNQFPFPVGNYIKVKTSGQHTCALNENGNGICTGRNDHGGQATPPLPNPGNIFIGLTTGFLSTCWWDNLGNPYCHGSSDKIPINPFPNWILADSEDEGLCYLYANTLSTNYLTQCFIDIRYSQSIVSYIPSTNFNQVTTNEEIACGIANIDGHIECWGTEFTYGGATILTTILNNIPLGSFIDITLGSGYACAIRDTFEIECWGNTWYSTINTYHCKSRGDILNNIPSSQFLNIDSGSCHVCGITINGTIECFGDDTYGQVSNIP